MSQSKAIPPNTGEVAEFWEDFVRDILARSSNAAIPCIALYLVGDFFHFHLPAGYEKAATPGMRAELAEMMRDIANEIEFGSAHEA